MVPTPTLVLDTDMASDLLKGRLPPWARRAVTGAAVGITFVTVAELWQWAELSGWGARRRDALNRWLHSVVVIDSDAQVSSSWGEIMAYARRRGRPRPVNDSWVAACCLSRGLPLMTNNVKDYLDYVEHEGLELVGVSG